MNENTVSRWIKRQFRETPWTAWIIAINVATWMLNFFGYPQPGGFLAGDVSVETAWRWLTYPLYSPMPVLYLLIGLFIFHWIASSLERAWGSEKFARVFVVATLGNAFSWWVASAIMAQSANPTFMQAGITGPEGVLFCIWAALNSEFTILAFFVIPVKAKYMAYFAWFMAFFGTGHPIVGLFAAIPLIAGWFWAKRPGAGSRPASVPKKAKSKKKKSSFKVLQGKGLDTGTETKKAPELTVVDRQKKAQEKAASQEELDRILDKIRFEGMDALTTAERESLDRQSRKLKEEG